MIGLLKNVHNIGTYFLKYEDYFYSLVYFIQYVRIMISDASASYKSHFYSKYHSRRNLIASHEDAVLKKSKKSFS